MTLLPGDAIRLDGREPPRLSKPFEGRAVHAVAGIGNPARFSVICAFGGSMSLSMRFPIIIRLQCKICRSVTIFRCS